MFESWINKIAALPWYFWALALAWGAIELAGWLRVKRLARRRRARSRGTAEPSGMGRWMPWRRAHE